ncbi:FeoC-like transcriptional regulator [Corynebacterium sp. TAE3-ERU30]|uniref:FeoC-like transcriptional regulator n=1 Tax=Corynebacterium sp. TAE3-ERU30 TaxID=2849496 RepID=UPI001C4829D2|nr:FeoC-like transcriptional regulator [Corynebacterium sp. TAE3-ERU30]MBV7281074.1 FeoC-like transcriptional regulator [Corynebacterium sp. TAE3-ERU30]
MTAPSSTTPSEASTDSTAPVRPLSAIRSAILHGSSTIGSISAATGLSPSVIRAGLEQLERMNLLTRKLQVSACSTSRSCASCTAHGSCEVPTQGESKGGIVTLSLSPLPPRD